MSAQCRFLRRDLDLLKFLFNILCAANLDQHRASEIEVVMAGKEARGFRQGEHARAKQRTRNHGETQHPSPRSRRRERIVRKICSQDSHCNCQLKERQPRALAGEISEM